MAGKKKSSKPSSKKKNNSEKEIDIVSLQEEEYVLVTDYSCSMSAHQDPEAGEEWRFALELFTKDGRLVDVHSQQTYQTFQDAILDCYGIVEYLGFGISDPTKHAQVIVSYWEEETEKYREELVYFDGSDFFKGQKAEEQQTQNG